MMTTSAQNEIAMTRTFDAPRELVFAMWTNPDHVAWWFGPKGFTMTIESMDVRPGGAWRFVMHGPDGRNYDNHIIYSVVDGAFAPVLLAHGPEIRRRDHVRRCRGKDAPHQSHDLRLG